MKQLNFYLGEENFRDGLRLYLKQHAYANAQWADLIHAFEATGHKDGQGWAKAWILQRGMPQVNVTFTCAAGKITGLTLTQQDVLHDGHTWPISNEVYLEFPVTRSGAPGITNASHAGLRVDWNTSKFQVREALGKRCPRYVFANFRDYGYGRFLLDPVSEKTVTADLEASNRTSDPLHYTMLWGALWEDVRVAQSPPSGYVELALKSLPTETDESMSRIQGGRVGATLHAYMSDKRRSALCRRASKP